MALKIRYFTRVSKKSEIAPIRVRFSHGRQFDTYATTGEQIKSKYWNQDTVRRVAEYPEAENMIDRLRQIEQHILSEYDKEPDKTGSNITSAWLSKTTDMFHNPGKYIQKGASLFSFIQHFVNNSSKRVNPKTGNPVCYKMQREYHITFGYLQKYAQQYGESDFADIDMEFYNNFTAMLREEGLQTNTVGKKIQTLKIFLNAAAEDGINEHFKYKSKNFKAVTEEADNIYLNMEELKQFYEYDLSHRPGLERVRDLFMVACWTGLRFSDLDQITSDRIYNGELPKPVSNQKYNESIKIAAKLAGLKAPFRKSYSKNGERINKKFEKHELISSHTARRSFCTNAYEMDIPTLTIMAISGHKSEAAFLKYIKVDGKKHAEKMRDMWQEKDFHMIVAK